MNTLLIIFFTCVAFTAICFVLCLCNIFKAFKDVQNANIDEDTFFNKRARGHILTYGGTVLGSIGSIIAGNAWIVEQCK